MPQQFFKNQINKFYAIKSVVIDDKEDENY